MEAEFYVVDIETTGRLPWQDKLLAVGVGSTVYTPDEGREAVQKILDQDSVVVCHTNFDLRWLCLDGVKFGDKVVFHDTKVMAWMLDDTQELTLDSLCQRYVGYTPPKPIKRVKGRIMFQSVEGLIPIEDVPWPELASYNESDLKSGAEVYEVLREKLKLAGLWEYFVLEEAPFSRLLIEMELQDYLLIELMPRSY